MAEALKQAINLASKVEAVSREVLDLHIEREDVVHSTFLSLVTGRPAFFLGSPGIDKTGTVQAMAGRIEGAKFYDALMPTVVSPEQLLVESTSIEEIADGGSKLISVRDELGRAAKAHLMFADEIWKSEPRLLQVLLDFARGGEIRHEGQVVKTPLLAFLAASNELPDPEGNLGALWSRMTLRVQVNALDRAGKTALVKARLQRDRHQNAGSSSAKLTLAEVEALRQARPHVEVPDSIVDVVLDILQELVEDDSTGFQWAWDDDRRFGRLFDILQAEGLLAGRTAVTKADLWVLEWLLWDTPEQIAVVKAKVAPYCRTPLMDAQELVDSLLAPGGVVAVVLGGDRSKGVQAISQCDACMEELGRLESEDGAAAREISALASQVRDKKQAVVAVVIGAKKGGA